mmetsp:Transcript_19633/g.29126  ORF Transcript_19633/g.29126 Transcript_19633/m.29126 type:complete len:346 (-) Transcript_19633:186-1223(-)|eukprot:CAMPEP_0194218928 /NCGR_PEP_ID=MMETSP0156-20130528/24847_1 /TAXON_ID=33649 /ORGANISM="Thalassionema nitzschioides, Strain L26-B" /LENGTH=345 /DNA_ID=CAMNT_0038948441 /DNA_START=43 /DNA_END=1080 /DNA_ORIENTATION=+
MSRIRTGANAYLDGSNHSVNSVRSMGSQRISKSNNSDGRVRDGQRRNASSSYLDRSNHSVNSIRSNISSASNTSVQSGGGRVRDGKPRNTTFKRSTSQVITNSERRQIPPSQEGFVNQTPRRKLNARGKGVAFSVIEIREHAITIGDNPGSLGGAPITIEWQAQDHMCIAVDEYERMRPHRRTVAEMNIPETIRADLLRKAGHTRGQIQQATKAANIARRHRKQTVASMELGPIHELGESLLRGGKNIMKRGKKKQERQFLMQAMKQSEQQVQRQPNANQRLAPAKPLARAQNTQRPPATKPTTAAAYGQNSTRRPTVQPPAPSMVQSMKSVSITYAQDENEMDC